MMKMRRPRKQRKKIEEEMMGMDPDLAAIFDQLHATRAAAKEWQKNLEKSIREKRKRLKKLSGDQSLSRQQIEETQIIVITPKKWDVITKKSGDWTYTQLLKLLIIGEIHLLHDGRGPVLESIVARSLRQVDRDLVEEPFC